MCVMQADFFAESFARVKTGNRIPAKIAMIAMTTNSSMSVNPNARVRFDLNFDTFFLL